MSQSLRAVAILSAFTIAATAEHYRFRNFGPDDGLNTAVTQVLQDHLGFLWVGSGDGLFRYDGAHFQLFGKNEGLSSSSIRCLHESADGTLWVLTGGGLGRWKQNRFESVVTGAESAGDWHAIGSSKDGKLYLGHDRGLAVGQVPASGPVPRFSAPAGAPTEPVFGIHVDDGGVVWFGCGQHLCVLDGRKVRVLGAAEGLPPERWGGMLRDTKGNLWIRGVQHLYVLRPGASRFEACDRGLPQSTNTIMTILQDRDGDLLASTDLGLARALREDIATDPTRANGRWKLIGAGEGLEGDTVTTVYQDREDSLWIGLWGAGLARWSGHQEWQSWTIGDGLRSNVIWAVRRQPGGPVWIGTDRGLARMDGDSIRRTWTKASGLAGDKIKAVALGPDGAVWAGSLPGGVSRVGPAGDIQNYGVESGLTDTHVIALFIDGQRRLWVSTSGGLFRSTSLGQRLRFERQSPPGTNESTTYFRFLGDRDGRIWVGSSAGLICWDGGWRRFGQRDGLRSDGVTHIAQTADGALWVAYREPTGMSRVTLTQTSLTVQHVTKQEGLPSDYVLFLGLDSQRRLWVGTDYGVAVQSSGGWTVYTHEDGLIWDDCAANSFWAEPDGTVWVGTLKGLSRFRPKVRSRVALPPPPAITSARFGPTVADVSAFSEVPFRDRDFFVTFSGLTYLTEKNVQFRYRLVGLGEEWIETAQREARFLSLPAGSYRFEVSARVGGGAWNDPPATLSFRIVPPWWQTWWFRALALGALAALITSLVRARVGKVGEEHRRLEAAVRERTSELEFQNNVVERQKKEIEGLLRRTQEVSRLKSEFLANMSHEIRTPMNGVIGMTQLALDTDLNAEQRDYINTIRDSAESLLVIINDVLDFSKIEAGKLELTHNTFDLRKCVHDAMQVFAWKAEEKKLCLTTDIAGDVPEFVVGDAGRLRQVLLNLLGNAMKFTDQGQITVSVRVEDGSAPEDAAATVLRFSVRDTGIGIPFDKQVMIFEAFAQVDGTVRRRQGGTGLGLAICTRLVHLMGGKIQVESSPGFGSDFYFTLTMSVSDTPPEADDDSAEPQPAVSAGRHSFASAALPMRILLAEDNPVNQKLASQILGKLGHTVAVVGNGREAVDAACKGQFDLILMDVQMPDLDGFEATRAIRGIESRAADEGRPVAHIPIVALTAHAMSGDRDLCLEAGMDAYISKPLHIQTLVETIERVRGIPRLLEQPARPSQAAMSQAAIDKGPESRDIITSTT